MVAALELLTPLGGLAALSAVVPLAALALAARRAQAARRVLGLAPPPRAGRVPLVAALALVPVLLGVAAAQPVIRSSSQVRVRTDAEAFFVIDTSRSMLAARTAGASTRLARARADAIQLRSELPEIPAGVATLTDHVLPHLFPSPDPTVFEQTVLRAVRVDAPPPATTAVVATSLGVLGSLGTQNFYSPTARQRLAIVLTDGESRAFDVQQTARALGQAPGVHVIFIHVWSSAETVFGTDGKPEQGYHVDLGSRVALDGLANAAGGSVFGEHDLKGAVRAARAALGAGPTVLEGRTVRTRTLAPYVALASLLPLLFVLGRGRAGGLRRALGRALRGGRRTVPGGRRPELDTGR